VPDFAARFFRARPSAAKLLERASRQLRLDVDVLQARLELRATEMECQELWDKITTTEK
jgi:hypothetical protein